MKNFLKIGEVNITPLLVELRSNPQLWNRHRMRKDREESPHSQMNDIWLRYNDISKYEPPYEGINDEHDSVWYDAYYCLPSAREIIFNIMATAYGERLGGVLITQIPPGGEIKPHADDGWHVRYYDKFYVSLESGPGANFYCEDEVICPNPGDVYWFDNTKMHWVINESNTDRTTLIVCIKTHRFGERSGS